MLSHFCSHNELDIVKVVVHECLAYASMLSRHLLKHNNDVKYFTSLSFSVLAHNGTVDLTNTVVECIIPRNDRLLKSALVSFGFHKANSDIRHAARPGTTQYDTYLVGGLSEAFLVSFGL